MTVDRTPAPFKRQARPAWAMVVMFLYATSTFLYKPALMMYVLHRYAAADAAASGHTPANSLPAAADGCTHGGAGRGGIILTTRLPVSWEAEHEQ